MTEFITNSAKITPYRKRPRHGGSFVTAYSHEPTANNPAADLGNLYCVAEVLVPGRQAEDLIDLIIETFGNQYYNQANQPFPLTRFEQAVKETNRQLASYVDKGNAAWIGKISAILAVVVGNEIHITNTGSAEGIIYRRHQSTSMTQDDAPRTSTPTKTFGVVASGELEVSDKILLATPALIHHLQSSKLTDIISHHSPAAAVEELSSLIDNLAADRVAALITEITTPDLAASQVIDSKPAEVTVGAPSNTAEAVKQIAIPAAGHTLQQSSRLLKHNSLQAMANAQKIHRQLKPILRRAGLKLAAMSRLLLSTNKRRRFVFITIVVLGLTSGYMIWSNVRSQQATASFKRYQQIFTQYQQLPASNGAEQEAIDQLIKLQATYAEFKTSEAAVNKSLANSNLRTGEPRSYIAMGQLLQQRLDQLTGVTVVEPTLIKNLKDAKISAKHFELVSAKLYLFAQGDQPAIHIVNTNSGNITTSSTNIRDIGNITATATAPNGDVIYLLTDKPEVWIYQLSTDKLYQAVLSYGSWPKGSSLATYASNLYILSENTIYKFTKNTSGFSPRTTYAQLDSTINNAKSLAIDGSVYVLNQHQLAELLSGSVRRTAELPMDMPQTDQLSTSESSSLLSAVDHQTDRIVVFSKNTSSLTFAYQLKPKELSGIQDAIYNPSTKQFYILTDTSLAKIPAK